MLMEFKLPVFYRTKWSADYSPEFWSAHCWTICIF